MSWSARGDIWWSVDGVVRRSDTVTVDGSTMRRGGPKLTWEAVVWNDLRTWISQNMTPLTKLKGVTSCVSVLWPPTSFSFVLCMCMSYTAGMLSPGGDATYILYNGLTRSSCVSVLWPATLFSCVACVWFTQTACYLQVVMPLIFCIMDCVMMCIYLSSHCLSFSIFMLAHGEHDVFFEAMLLICVFSY